MSERVITVSSRALGCREKVSVHVYETVEQLRRAATAYNGTDNHGTLGVTQVSCWAKDGRLRSVIIRLARGHLSTQIVGHEMHHAATAIYGDHVGGRVSSKTHLTHHNEPFAHLFSDLLCKLVDRLYALGYYAT